MVFPKSSLKKTVEELIRVVSLEFEEDLNLMSIGEKRVRGGYNFNFSLRIPKYKTIFTYDLFNGSRTIWGRDFIGEKSISVAEIDPYEAKRLVANRIGELIYLQSFTDSDNRDYPRKQWKGKLILAIVSAWLICEGEYISSYHGQYQKVHEKNAIENVLGEGFLAEYEKVFCFLREEGSAHEVSDKLMIDYVKRMDQFFKQKQIKRPKVNSISRLFKYTLKYIKTGMKYGLIGFEDNILQALIADYWQKSEGLASDGEVWHRVLY